MPIEQLPLRLPDDLVRRFERSVQTTTTMIHRIRPCRLASEMAEWERMTHPRKLRR
jgi:hypothetical protein